MSECDLPDDNCIILWNNTRNIPHVYIDEKLINIKKNTGQFICNKFNGFMEVPRKVYEINGDIFHEESYTMQKETYFEFEIRQSDIIETTNIGTEINVNIYDKKENSESLYLNVSIAKVSDGVIINGNVYLTDQKWNTILSVEETIAQCAVCNVCFEVNEYQEHINKEEHLKSLSLHLPLEKYDLSIVRKIQDKYHCGVCNELIDVASSKEHWDGKNHEDMQLFAINRVSDIFEFDARKREDEEIDSYRFDAHAINNNNNDDQGNKNWEEDEGSYEGFYDYPWNERRVDSETDRVESENQSTDDCQSEIEECQRIFSYASVARKQKLNPNYIEVMVEGKKFNVPFDVWHMILTPQNYFYCMVCKEKDHISLKGDHCCNDEHLKQLQACTIVNDYKGYLIRKVDQKLYHCGQCNNLQLIHEMKEHVETNHPLIKYKNLVENDTSVLMAKANRTASCRTNKSAKADKHKAQHMPKTIIHYEVDHNHNTVKDNLVTNNVVDLPVKKLYIFGNTFTLPKSSYNMVLIEGTYCFCCVCEIAFSASDLSTHIQYVRHIDMLQRSPYVYNSGCNLMRKLRNNTLHCAICNTIVAQESVKSHIMSLKHVMLFQKSISKCVTTNVANDPVHVTPSGGRTTSFSENDKNDDFDTLKHVNKADDVKTESVSQTNIKNDGNITVTDKTKATDELQGNTHEVNENAVDLKEETNENEDDAELSQINPEEHVYVKLKNTFIKITRTSFDTLVPVGDGSRYCFLCSTQVLFMDLKRHIDSREHLRNLEKYNFLENYGNHLLRQMYLTYHCSLCNVIVSRQYLNGHLTWSTHLQRSVFSHKINKKNRKVDFKSGMKQIVIKTQKEITYLNEKDATSNIEYDINIEFEDETLSRLGRKIKSK